MKLTASLYILQKDVRVSTERGLSKCPWVSRMLGPRLMRALKDAGKGPWVSQKIVAPRAAPHEIGAAPKNDISSVGLDLGVIADGSTAIQRAVRGATLIALEVG